MQIRHILMRENSVDDFAETMAYVELAVKEQSRQTEEHAAQ